MNEYHSSEQLTPLACRIYSVRITFERWQMAMAMANGIELETLNLELETMADGDAPSTHQRLNASTFASDLSPLTFDL